MKKPTITTATAKVKATEAAAKVEAYRTAAKVADKAEADRAEASRKAYFAKLAAKEADKAVAADDILNISEAAKRAARLAAEAVEAKEAEAEATEKAEAAKRKAEAAKAEADKAISEAAAEAAEALNTAEAVENNRAAIAAKLAADITAAAEAAEAIAEARRNLYRRRAVYKVIFDYTDRRAVYTVTAYAIPEAIDKATAKTEATDKADKIRAFEIIDRRNISDRAEAIARRTALNAVLRQGTPKQYRILAAAYSHNRLYNSDFADMVAEAAAAFAVVLSEYTKAAKVAADMVEAAKADRAEALQSGIIEAKDKKRTAAEKRAAVYAEAAKVAALREAASPFWIEAASKVAFKFVNLWLELQRSIRSEAKAEAIPLADIENTAAAPTEADRENEAQNTAENRAIIAAMLKTATEADRRIIQLIFKGYSIRATADRLKKSEKTIRRRLECLRAAAILAAPPTAARRFGITEADRTAAENATAEAEAKAAKSEKQAAAEALKKTATDRAAVIKTMCENGAKIADIAAAVGISRQAVEKHLKKAAAEK